jgi:hypothetical protein
VLFYYFDPLHSLGPEMQERWRDPVEQERMLEAAREAARPTAASSITAAPVTGELPN